MVSKVSVSIRILSLLLLLQIVGCGFQPINSLSVNQHLQPVELKAIDSLSVATKRALQSNGVKVRDTAFKKVEEGSAKTRLTIKNIDWQQRNHSVSFSGKNAEYLLILSAEVAWHTLEVPASVLFDEELSLESIVYANPSNPGAERSEIRAGKKLLEQQLAQEIMMLMNVATVEPSASTAKEPSAAVNEEPFAPVNEEPSASSSEEPSAPVNEVPSASDAQQSSTYYDKESSASPMR